LRERAVLYVNGRLDRVVEDANDVCAGAVYAPFAELASDALALGRAYWPVPAMTAPKNNHP